MVVKSPVIFAELLIASKDIIEGIVIESTTQPEHFVAIDDNH
jgi:hypothetical protein